MVEPIEPVSRSIRSSLPHALNPGCNARPSQDDSPERCGDTWEHSREENGFGSHFSESTGSGLKGCLGCVRLLVEPREGSTRVVWVCLRQRFIGVLAEGFEFLPWLHQVWTGAYS